MSSTAWLTRRSVSLGLSEHSPARSHRSDEPTTRDSPGRCSAPDLRVVPLRQGEPCAEDAYRIGYLKTSFARWHPEQMPCGPTDSTAGLRLDRLSAVCSATAYAIPSYSLGEH